MTRLVSTNIKIKQLDGLLGTRDLNDWERGFVANIVAITQDGTQPGKLTEKQLERVDAMWEKHFA
jgi:hypothetical protein